MAHKIIDGKVIVDWTTGDPEGDRLTLLSAYRDFIKEVIDLTKIEGSEAIYCADKLNQLINKWSVSTTNQVDDVPRIWIRRPRS